QRLVVARDRDRPPEPTLHDDRARNGRDDAQPTRSFGKGTVGRRRLTCVDSRRTSRTKDLRRRQDLVELPAAADWHDRFDALRHADDEDRRAVGVEPGNRRLLPAEPPTDFSGPGGEDLRTP